MQKVDFILVDTLVFNPAEDNSMEKYHDLINQCVALLGNNLILARHTYPKPQYYLIDMLSQKSRKLTYQDQPHLFLHTNSDHLNKFYFLNKPKIKISEEVIKQVALNLTLGLPFYHGFTE